jgi:tRNA (cytidine/uridine-2'-O-)-methyltransferase
MRLVLYQPDIPQNTGTLMRLAACWGVTLAIVGPCGFVWDDRKLRRAGMDYGARATVQHFDSWTAWRAAAPPRRLIAVETCGATPYAAFTFQPDDQLVLGPESAGLPPEVLDSADACVRIPMLPGMRSINVALAGAVVLGEALRQTRQDWLDASQGAGQVVLI